MALNPAFWEGVPFWGRSLLCYQCLAVLTAQGPKKNRKVLRFSKQKHEVRISLRCSTRKSKCRQELHELKDQPLSCIHFNGCHFAVMTQRLRLRDGKVNRNSRGFLLSEELLVCIYIYIHINAYTYYMHIYIRNVCLYVKSTKYIISIYTHTWILLYTQIKYIICIYSNPSPKKTLGSHGPKGWVSPTS